MKKIAVFTTGDAAGAERLVTLFNEGNRLRIDTVITDGDPAALSDRLKEYDVKIIGLPPEADPEEMARVGKILTESEIDLYALDGYTGFFEEWVKVRYPEKLVNLTSAEEAPREVVAAVTKMNERAAESAKPEPPAPKTVDEEWAETLQIDFDSKRAEEAARHAEETAARLAGQTPPPVPGQQPPVPPRPDFSRNPQYVTQQPSYPQNAQQQSGQPQYGNVPVNSEPMPKTYLVWSVIMTVLCCLIPGVVAIIFSSQVSTKYFAGDLEGAKRASRNAEIWIIVSFVLGVLSATLYLPIMMVS